MSTSEDKDNSSSTNTSSNSAVDGGGCVNPMQTCPHIFSGSFDPSVLLKVEAAFHAPEAAPCSCCQSEQENWFCLKCGMSNCSRYVNGHSETHFFESMSEPAAHCLALSRSDLSVWCYACGEYVKHDALYPVLTAAAASKFKSEPASLRKCITNFNVGIALPSAQMNGHHARGRHLERPERTTSVKTVLDEKAQLAKLRTIPYEPVAIEVSS